MTRAGLEQLSHIARQVGPDVQARIDALGIGQKMQDLPEELWHESFRFYVKEDPTRKGGPNLRIIRLDPSKPSLTVTAYIYNKFVHPFEDRYITPREAARLQDFPDTFIFKGTLTSVQRQVGNAVPVRLSAAVARSVLAHALEHGTLKAHLKRHGDYVPALSLFSGVGGLDMGFGPELGRTMGIEFRSVACIEFDEDCCKTLSANLDCAVMPADISAIDSPASYLRRVAGISSAAIVIGGPPCQAFSQAGRQKADEDERGRLVFEFLRFIGDLRPTYFVMENVANLRGVSGGQLYAAVVAEMKRLGYNVALFRLCAADYGTAQLRWRLFLVGVAGDYPAVAPPAQTHYPADAPGKGQRYRTVKDAFAGLPKIAKRQPASPLCADDEWGASPSSASRLRLSHSPR